MAKIDKEISESGSTIANLRENLRVRKIEKEIKKTREEIASYDMEEAAKAKRNFESKWDVVKKREDELKAAVSGSPFDSGSFYSTSSALLVFQN
jgi:DNA repair protein RAD50